MSVNEEIIPLIVHDYKSQDVQRLSTWFARFPDAYELLCRGLREAALKAALRDRLWVSAAFLLSSPSVKEKTAQITQLSDSEDPILPVFIQANLHGRVSSKFHLLEKVYGMGRSD
tara:strand:- start:1073 stop:1417 length:345 start_codon:yes stop_codon:yes gene_type:complete